MWGLISEIMFEIARQHIWQSGLFTIFVLSVIRIYPAMSHETRSWLWFSAFLLAIALPFAVFLPDDQNISAVVGLISANPGQNIPDIADGNIFHLPLTHWIFYIWITGAAIMLAGLGKSAVHTWGIISRTGKLPDSLDIFIRKINHDIPVYSSDRISSPLVTGFRRQVILLPEYMLTALSPEALTGILHHEYAHIHRNDMRVMVIQRLLCAIFWWNPVIYFMSARLDRSREMACDERAAHKTGDALQYAHSLLSSAEQIILAKQRYLAVSIFQKKQNLKQRIERLKIMNINTIRHGRMTVFIWCLGLVTIAAGAAYILTPRLAQADQADITGEIITYKESLLPISQTPPGYPEMALENRLEGYVILK
ncbi:hypothetical protein MNBD_ALPHA01-538, partial [hydrothermal vent metagenome]